MASPSFPRICGRRFLVGQAVPDVLEKHRGSPVCYVAVAGVLHCLSTQSHNTRSFIATPTEHNLSVISSNKWFRRAWVLQEVANKSNVSIRVGTDETDWVVFRSIFTVFLEAVTTCAGWNHCLVPPTTVLPPIWRDISRTGSGVMPIIRILLNLTDFYSTDPRDMVYATYHLASDIPAESLNQIIHTRSPRHIRDSQLGL